MKLQRSSSPRSLPAGAVHIPLRRLALCLDCDECFELGFQNCPVCGSGTWSPVARFIDLVADTRTHRPGASTNKLVARRASGAAQPVKHLFIVARNQRELFDHLSRAFAKHEAVEVLLDRRGGERRQRQTDAPVLERRRGDRRRNAVDEQIRTFGWALVLVDLPAQKRA